MPELPEVESVVRTVRPRVVGRQVRRVLLTRDDYATPANFAWSGLVGSIIDGVRRRGKRILIDTSRGGVLVHLGMTGRLTVADPREPVAKHTHARFDLGEIEMRLCDPRRFGRLHWLGASADDADVGPEPLTLPAAGLATRLKKTKRAVKVALLDQKLLAGLGNIYVDEALHAAGIHPRQAASSVDRQQVGRLSGAIKRVLRRAIDAGGSTLRDYVDADGNPGAFQKLHRVYARAGEPCRRCRTPIARVVLGGRSTHFCPQCQPSVQPT